MMDMRGMTIFDRTLKAGLMVSLLAAGPCLAFAQTQEAAPAPQEAPKLQSQKHKGAEARHQASGLEARHQECLAFIQRHGLSCDPWQTPTCGYDVGYARPMSCVAP